jgi:hypothetical protein
MTTSEPQACEVKIEGAWRSVGLSDAISRYALAMKRCPACQGRVSINGAYSGPTFRRTITHRKAHTGCPLDAKRYSGTPSLHPQAVA